MRSSKSRSRSKSNRQRSPLGNIVNRVFDSSGPEGKVRGTPQQIIDKYLTLARDAQLGNDRVAAENFQQHAEHYARMLGEAQREMEAQRQQYGNDQPREGGEARRDDQAEGQDEARRDDQGEPRRDGRGDERRNDDRRDFRGEGRRDDWRDRPRRAEAQPGPAEVIDTAPEEGAGLVETPEMRVAAPAEPAPQQPAAEAPRDSRPRRPRRPKAEKAATDQPTPPSEAAE